MKKSINSRLLSALFAALLLALSSHAQKQGKALTDSLIAEVPKAAEDTNKVLLLLDISFYSSTTDPEQGISYGKNALQLAEKLDYPQGIAVANRYIGINLGARSLFPEALEYYFKSLKKYEELKDKNGAAKVSMSIGLVYVGKNDFPNALKYLEEALATFEATKNKIAIAKTLNNIGIVYNKMDNFLKALEYYTRALKINEELGDVRSQESNISNIAAVNMSLKQEDKALEYYFKALEVNDKTGNTHYRAVHLTGIGNTYLRIVKDTTGKKLERFFSGDKTKALLQSRKYLEDGIALFNQLGNRSDVYLNYQSLSEACELLGDLDGALDSYKKFVSARDSVYNEENTKKALEMQLRFDYEKKEALAQKEIQREKLARNGFIGGFAVMLLFAVVFLFQRNRIRKGKQESDKLLLNILPEEVAEELKTNGSAAARHYPEVSILFTDFKDFTALSEKMKPQELVAEMDHCFRRFDEIISSHGIEKIKTIGDAYMAAAGLPVQRSDHAKVLVAAALEIRDFMNAYKAERQQAGKVFFEIRIGINSGEVVAGIVGVKKFAYDIWGDAVNMASRMESTGETGKVNISESTYRLVREDFRCEYRGELDAKGKGKVKMYFVEK